jgi:prophage tail gpP-like protein
MNLKINHRIGDGIVDVIYFNDFEVDLKFDSVASTFSFNSYFDPYNRSHAELYCLSHFHDCTLQDDGETLITGRLMGNEFGLSSVKELSKLGGYSLPGVLEDCSIPPTIYPLETNGLSIAQIARKIAAPFHLNVVIDPLVADAMNKPIAKTAPEPTQTCKDYLTELCTQRHIIITHNEKGELLFTKAKTDLQPITHFEEGISGVTIRTVFQGQGIHSHITVMKQASSDGGNAGEFTIRNPYCPVAHVYRPIVITQSSGDDITTEEFAQQQLAAELKNIKIIINTDRWKIDGKIIRPNNVVSVFSPSAYIYKKVNLFVESVRLKGDSKSRTAELTCVLPEVYNGQMPKNIFVDAHLNLPRFQYPKQN